MAKREEIVEEVLDEVNGGAMNLSYKRGAEFGSISSSVTGQTYTFAAANLEAVATIMAAKGIEEADKIQQMQRYFV